MYEHVNDQESPLHIQSNSVSSASDEVIRRVAQLKVEINRANTLYYIENASLLLDFKIMVRTIWFVLAGKSTR